MNSLDIIALIIGFGLAAFVVVTLIGYYIAFSQKGDGKE